MLNRFFKSRSTSSSERIDPIIRHLDKVLCSFKRKDLHEGFVSFLFNLSTDFVWKAKERATNSDCFGRTDLLCWGIYLERKTPVPQPSKAKTRVKFPKKDSLMIANLARNIKTFDFKELLRVGQDSSNKGRIYA